MSKMFDLEERAKIRAAREASETGAQTRDRELRNQIAKSIADDTNNYSRKYGQHCTAVSRHDEVTFTSTDGREMVMRITSEEDFECSYKNMSQLHVAGLSQPYSSVEKKDIQDSVLDWYKVISR